MMSCVLECAPACSPAPSRKKQPEPSMVFCLGSREGEQRRWLGMRLILSVEGRRGQEGGRVPCKTAGTAQVGDCQMAHPPCAQTPWRRSRLVWP